MTPSRLLTLDHLLADDQARSGLYSCHYVLVSLGYEILKYSIFRSLLLAFRPSAVIDIRVSASFRDHGFTPERTFHAFGLLGVEYKRFDCDDDPTGLAGHILANSHAWFAKGPIFLLGASRDHLGSEREKFACELARYSSIRLLFHERNSLERWLLTDLNRPSQMNVSRVLNGSDNENVPAQLSFPMLFDKGHK